MFRMYCKVNLSNNKIFKRTFMDFDKRYEKCTN